MTITAFLDIKLKAEALETAPAIITETLKATRAFPGCLGVEVVIDNGDETHVVLIEHWDSVESDSAYRAWRATPEGSSRLREIVAAAPELTFFQDYPDI